MLDDDRVQTLQDKHAEIDAELQSLMSVPVHSGIAELKKAKLAIKDEIRRLQEEISVLAT